MGVGVLKSIWGSFPFDTYSQLEYKCQEMSVMGTFQSSLLTLIFFLLKTMYCYRHNACFGQSLALPFRTL